MSFDAFPFWVFLLAVWGGYLVVRHNAARKALLIVTAILYATSRSKRFFLLAVTAGSYASVLPSARTQAPCSPPVCVAVAALAAAKHG